MFSRMCLGARDPYCGWDRKQRRCTTIEDSSNMSQWFQNITACPVSVKHLLMHKGWLTTWLNFPLFYRCNSFGLKALWLFCVLYINIHVLFQLRNQTTDGAYGPWTTWQPCSHDDGDGTSACLCRSRACDRPRPLCGGKMCEGPTIEVANCSR